MLAAFLFAWLSTQTLSIFVFCGLPFIVPSAHPCKSEDETRALFLAVITEALLSQLSFPAIYGVPLKKIIANEKNCGKKLEEKIFSGNDSNVKKRNRS